MPIDIEPLEQSVTLTNETASCTVFTRGVKEYQQLDQDLALTLLATTGQLGKPDLAYRPGRASGDTTKKGHVLIETEGAQLLGKHQFRLAIYLGIKPSMSIKQLNEQKRLIKQTYPINANRSITFYIAWITKFKKRNGN